MRDYMKLEEYCQESFKGQQIVETRAPEEFWGAIYAGVPVVVTPSYIDDDMLGYNLGEMGGFVPVYLSHLNVSDFIRESKTRIISCNDARHTGDIIKEADKIWVPYDLEYIPMSDDTKREFGEKLTQYQTQNPHADTKSTDLFLEDLLKKL